MNKIIDNLKLNVESTYGDAVESMENIIDASTTFVKKSYTNTIITFEGLASIGLTLALITAPVPTLIAVYLMWVIGVSIEDSNKSLTLENDNKKQIKKTNRAISCLKKYGKIPKTATIETPYLSMVIDSENGNISGTLLKGTYKNIPLSDLDNESIKELISNDSDSETHDLLVAYLTYREKAGV